jgi:hypothetical protein
MATSRIPGIQAFESRFPVVAANLRALVSSWLPAARDPSPIDDDANRETAAAAGRPERYQSKGLKKKLIERRLALGATQTSQQTTSIYQSRMNRKMGVSTNGTPKTESSKSKVGSGLQGSTGKRKIVETESDSEDNSKSKLVKKIERPKQVVNILVPRKKKKLADQEGTKVSSTEIPSVQATSATKETHVSEKLKKQTDEGEPSSEGLVVKEESSFRIFSTTENGVESLVEKVKGVEEGTKDLDELEREERKRAKKKAKNEKKRLKKLAKRQAAAAEG